MSGTIILIVTLVAFVAIGIFFLWGRTHFSLPEGQNITYTYRGYKVHTIVSTHCQNISIPLLAKAAEKAIAATMDTWKKYSNIEEYDLHSNKDDTKEFVVYFVPNSNMPPGAASYFTSLGSITGSNSLPFIIVGESYAREVMDTGEPVIHEVLHLLCDLDRYHDSITVWQENWKKFEGHVTVQKLAEIEYLDYKDFG